VGATADEVIRPLLELMLSVLNDCGVMGKMLVHLYVRITPTLDSVGPVLTVHIAHEAGGLHAAPGEEEFFGGDITLPPEDDATRALAEQMMGELARSSGLDWFER
jgi:hypothetical protein